MNERLSVWLGRGALLVLAAACTQRAKEMPAAGSAGNGTASGAALDAGKFANADAAALRNRDARVPHDAEVTADAFFVNDPPPPYCGPDGGAPTVQKPGGTPSCPSDKNRTGCPCDVKDMTASCWPGKRANRNHGICKDGTTTCMPTTEFGNRWGACEGYVLPNDTATFGAAACGCFSLGQWKLDNLSPCIITDTTTGTKYVTSSRLLPSGMVDCGMPMRLPPPPPSSVWTQSTLNVDCAGQFKLCFTIKVGDVKNPHPDDCVVAKSCVDAWYPVANVDQQLPPLPGWASSDPTCGSRFDQQGGYGEMSVVGTSSECEKVDDGTANPFVFQRMGYCATTCSTNPSAPGCQSCMTGGSGQFGH